MYKIFKSFNFFWGGGDKVKRINIFFINVGFLLGVKPLYAEISEWRKILSRLCSFLRSVDYLILEMLRRLVLTAVRQLLDHLVASYNVTDEDEERV